MASSRSASLIPPLTAPSLAPPSTTPTTPATSSTPLATSSPNGATSTLSTSSPSTQSTAATPSTPSSSSLLTSLPSTGSQLVTTAGGTVDTVTSTSFVISSSTPTAQNNSTSSNSFFSNKGAVAGVFTVVGLIVFALIIALVVNAIRRRRAQKFDRDVAEAAAEAAASSRSPFDDYSYLNPGGNGGGGGGGGYGYSDNSHGTYQLPPLPPHGDPYGPSEMSQYDPYAAGAASLAAVAVGRSRSRKDSEPGTPGIAGVGAGTLAREPSKRAPYHAFAGPGPQPHEFQGTNGAFGSRRSHQDVLEAAGLGALPGAAPIPSNTTPNGGAGNAYVSRRPSNTTQNTHFNGGRSQFGSVSSGGHHPPTLQPGYPVDSYYPQRSDSLSPDPFAGYPVRTVPSQPLLNPHDASAAAAVAPLPSIAGHQSEHHEDSVNSSPTALRSDEQRMSYQDDTDYSQGNRVLRVANE